MQLLRLEVIKFLLVCNFAAFRPAVTSLTTIVAAERYDEVCTILLLFGDVRYIIR